ncbi:MAG: hypothetical protein GY711_00290 [bacterium]|nr:hypothetical protein [bacterium]
MDFSENLRGEVKISATTGGFTGTIDPGDKFGSGVAAADINLDGIDEIFVGMPDEFAGGADASGAVWALDIDCIDDARELIRNSALAPNPFNFNGGVSGPPMIGQNWDPFVTPVLPVATSFDFVIVDTRAPIDVPNFLGWGTLLCQIPHAGQQFVNAQHGQPFSIPIPNDCSLVGVTACTQAGTFDTTTGQITLWNAIDIRIGTIDL